METANRARAKDKCKHANRVMGNENNESPD